MLPNSYPVSSFSHAQYITTDTPHGKILISGRITGTLLWLRLTAVQKDTLNEMFHKPTGSGAHQVHRRRLER